MVRLFNRGVGCVIAAAIFGLAGAEPVRAGIGVIPVADTFVSAAQPNGNFGGAGSLETSASGLAKGEFQALLRFDLSGVKSSLDASFGAGQWFVLSATLQLTASNPAPNPVFNANVAGQFSVSWMTNDSWVEGTGSPSGPTADGVTFNTLGTFLSGSDEAEGTFGFAGGISGTAVYSLPLGSGLVGDINGGSTASLRVLAADSAVSYLFNSRSFGTAANRPLLTINAVPEPGAAIVGVVGAMIVGLGRRRR